MSTPVQWTLSLHKMEQVKYNRSIFPGVCMSLTTVSNVP